MSFRSIDVGLRMTHAIEDAVVVARGDGFGKPGEAVLVGDDSVEFELFLGNFRRSVSVARHNRPNRIVLAGGSGFDYDQMSLMPQIGQTVTVTYEDRDSLHAPLWTPNHLAVAEGYTQGIIQGHVDFVPSLSGENVIPVLRRKALPSEESNAGNQFLYEMPQDVLNSFEFGHDVKWAADAYWTQQPPADDFSLLRATSIRFA